MKIKKIHITKHSRNKKKSKKFYLIDKPILAIKNPDTPKKISNVRKEIRKMKVYEHGELEKMGLDNVHSKSENPHPQDIEIVGYDF